MAEEQKFEPFTGRLYHFAYRLCIVVPVPFVGGLAPADPLEIRARVGKILHRALQAAPIFTTFKVTPHGVPQSEAAFAPSLQEAVTKMEDFLKAQEPAESETPVLDKIDHLLSDPEKSTTQILEEISDLVQKALSGPSNPRIVFPTSES